LVKAKEWASPQDIFTILISVLFEIGTGIGDWVI